MTTVVIILLILITVTLLWLLIAPIRLVVNSETEEYYFELPGVLKLQVIFEEALKIKLRIKVFFYSFIIDPMKVTKNRKENKLKKPVTKKKKESSSSSFNTGLRILKSFQVKLFKLDIDTGEFMYNAWLFPVFEVLNGMASKNVQLAINYYGNTSLQMVIQNRGYRIIKAIINKS